MHNEKDGEQMTYRDLSDEDVKLADDPGMRGEELDGYNMTPHDDWDAEQGALRDYSAGGSGGAPTKPMNSHIEARLEYMRGEIKAERMDYGDIAELQSYAAYIPEGDVELLEWAGVPEFGPEA